MIPPPKLRVPYEDGSGYLEINPFDIDYSEQIFTHINHDDGVQRHYYINKLYEMAVADPVGFPLQNIELEASVASHISRTKGIDRKHVKNMSPKRAMEPGLILLFDEQLLTVIDGNHRYLKRLSMGRTHMRFYVFTEAEARPAKLILPDAFGRHIVK
jgi:hypothetical protein